MAARMLYFTLLVAVFTIFTSAQFIPPASLVPHSCTCKDAEPICFYNKACNPTCSGQPDPASCTQSIDYACKKLASTPANGTNSFIEISSSGSLNLAFDNATAQCAALIRYSGIQTATTYDQCVQSFAQIQGCSETTHVGFKAGCVGCTINFAFCDENLYSIVDLTKPAYALGNANQLQIVPSEVLALKAPP